MQFNQNKIIYALIAVVFIGFLWGIATHEEAEPKQANTTSESLDVPVIMHTSGGRLEVATVTATEGFRREAAPQYFFGIDLGETVSHIQAKVIYRYHIDMDVKWQIKLQGDKAIVHAKAVKPTIPVAFDTTTLRKSTQSGWARFDKEANLRELERALTPELARRASGYLPLTLNSARETVSVFVRTWLISKNHWKPGSKQEVKVLFPGETE